MKYRTIKATPEGNQSREKVREVVRGVHVIPVSKGSWEVRTLGMKPISKTFGKETEAVTFAETLSRKRHAKVVNHAKSEGRPARAT